MAVADAVRAVSRATVAATRATQGLPALPEAQVAVLRTLRSSPSMTPAELAERLGLARPTVSNLLRDLEAAGHVTRARSEVDRRSVILTITEQARTCRTRSNAAVARSSRPPGPHSTRADRLPWPRRRRRCVDWPTCCTTAPSRRLGTSSTDDHRDRRTCQRPSRPRTVAGDRLMTRVAQTSVAESVADYAALPGPGGRESKMPALDAKAWTLKVALSQRPWSFVASIAMAAAFVCNGLTPVVVGRPWTKPSPRRRCSRLGFWILVLAGLYLVAAGVNWVARFMLVRSQQLVGHDLRTMVTDRIQDPRGFAGRERTPGGLLSIASSDTQRVGEIVMMTVMPVAEAASITYGAIVMYTHQPLAQSRDSRRRAAAGDRGPARRPPAATPFVARQQSIAQAAATAADVVQGLRILKGLGAITHRPRSLRRGVRDRVRQDDPGQRGRGTSQRCHRCHRCDLRLQSRHRRWCARPQRGRDHRSAHHRRRPDPVPDHPDDDARQEPRLALGLGGGVRTADPRSPRCRLRAQRGGGRRPDHPLHRRTAHRPHRRPRCRPRAGIAARVTSPDPGDRRPARRRPVRRKCRRQRVSRSRRRRAGSPRRLLRRHPRGLPTSGWAKADACSPAVSASECRWPAPSRSTPKSSSSRIRPRQWTR